MGFFSWKTADTGKSIANIHSGMPTFTVYLTAPDGAQWIEHDYDGYGQFGGKDIYDLIAELNGWKDRSEAIDQMNKITRSLDFTECSNKGIKLPTLTESKENPFQFGYPANCEFQGYFYKDPLEEEEIQNAFTDAQERFDSLHPLTKNFMSLESGIDEQFDLRYAFGGNDNALYFLGKFLEGKDLEDEETEALGFIFANTPEIDTWCHAKNPFSKGDDTWECLKDIFIEYRLNQDGKETNTYNIPSHFMSYLINGDDTSLNDEEIELIDEWQTDQKIIYIGEYEEQSHFVNRPDILQPTLASDCVEVTAICKLENEDLDLEQTDEEGIKA